MNCSVAQALEILGERWTMLIIRDAFLGVRRFEDFLKAGMSRNVLTDRLKKLISEGILEKTPVDGKTSHYTLTAKGTDVMPALLSLMHWGDKYLPHPSGTRITITDRQTGQPIANMAPRNLDGHALDVGDLGVEFGPALKPKP